MPRGNKKPPRINAALLREMWRTVSSLELLPVSAKTEVGDFKESELWCLSRLGARKFFYGPTKAVLEGEEDDCRAGAHFRRGF